MGYDDEYFLAINSYGQENGPFRIPKELLPTLFTRYAIIDKKDEERIYSYKSRIMDAISIEDAKKAFEDGIWNGLDPKNPATREEVAAIIYRAMQKMAK